VAKDRARPFSRKHRKYWFTVTGGMLLICLINVGIGMCGYEPPVTPERIIPVIPAATPEPRPTDGSIPLREIPTPVMRAFAVAYPRHLPAPKKLVVAGETRYELTFTDAGRTTTAVYAADGAFLGAR